MSPSPASGPAGPYADWVAWIEDFGRGEDGPMGHLAPLSQALGGYGQVSLVGRLAEAFGERAQNWQAVLGRRLATRTGPVELILIDARRLLRPLVRLAGSPLLPAEVADGLNKALADLVAGTRSELEKAVPRGPDFEGLRRAVRTIALIVPEADPAGRPPDPGDPAEPTGRRIIFHDPA